MTGDADSFVEHRRLITAGSDISGLLSAIYAARSNNEPLVLESDESGGQLTFTTEVDNYPGFPEGISGPELINNMKEQVGHPGTEIRHGIIEDVGALERPFTVTLKDGDVYAADTLVVASGASAHTLGIPGGKNLMGYGLLTCVTCDGAFFRGEKITVIGEGDAAVEEANFLAKFTSTVYFVHRREEFRAEDYWIDRLMEKVDEGEIEPILNTEATELYGLPEEGVDYATLVRNPEGHPSDKLDNPETEESDFDVGAVFCAIGHTPNTDYLDSTGVQHDDDGYIIIKGGSGGGQTATDVPGIFAAGDVVDHYYQQAATAGGMGVRVALDADNYLEELEHEEKQTATSVAE